MEQSWDHKSLQFKNAEMKSRYYEIPITELILEKIWDFITTILSKIFCNIHDIFYSSHVIEHLPDPNILFTVA